MSQTGHVGVEGCGLKRIITFHFYEGLYSVFLVSKASLDCAEDVFRWHVGVNWTMDVPTVNTVTFNRNQLTVPLSIICSKR